MSSDQFTIKDVEILEESIPYQNFFRIKRYLLRHRLFKGGWSNVFEREIFDRRPVAAALPYDPVLNKVVLIEQFRTGALQDKKSPWLLELVAGITEPNETAESMILREVKEEADLDVKDLLKITEYWVSPGGSSEYLTLYCAKVDASHAGGIHGLSEEHEDIRVYAIDTEIAFEALSSGKINNAVTIVALQWLKINKDNLHWRK